MTAGDRQYGDLSENPNGYCPNHATGVKLPDDFVVTPLQYVDESGQRGRAPARPIVGQ